MPSEQEPANDILATEPVLTPEEEKAAREQQRVSLRRFEFIKGLLGLADLLNKHPELPVPTAYDCSIYSFNLAPGQKLTELCRLIVPFKRDTYADGHDIEIYHELSSNVKYSLNQERSQVCTSRVVGKKTVERRVATAWTIEREEIDELEWDCPSILNSSEESNTSDSAAEEES